MSRSVEEARTSPVTVRLTESLANDLHVTLNIRAALKVRPWQKQDVVAEAISDWLEKHRDETPSLPVGDDA